MVILFFIISGRFARIWVFKVQLQLNFAIRASFRLNRPLRYAGIWESADAHFPSWKNYWTNRDLHL